MSDPKRYKIVKKKDRYYVLRKEDNSATAARSYVFLSDDIQDCEDWIKRQEAWFI